MNADFVIKQLTKLDYFKYVTETNREKVQNLVKESYVRYKYLDAYDDEINHSLERRIYPIDPESLCEGGVDLFLQDLDFIFQKEGVEIKTINNEISWPEPASENYVYYLFVNKNKYRIIDSTKGDSPISWDLAHKRAIEIANDLLKEAGSKERIFPQCKPFGGESIIILTENLYEYVQTLPLMKEHAPFRVEELE